MSEDIEYLVGRYWQRVAVVVGAVAIAGISAFAIWPSDDGAVDAFAPGTAAGDSTELQPLTGAVDSQELLNADQTDAASPLTPEDPSSPAADPQVLQVTTAPESSSSSITSEATTTTAAPTTTASTAAPSSTTAEPTTTTEQATASSEAMTSSTESTPPADDSTPSTENSTTTVTTTDPTVQSTTTTELTTTTRSGDDRAFEQRVIDLTNQARTQAGCPALSHNEKLRQASWEHSKDMKQNNYFDHDGLDGSSAGDRMERQGYEWWSWAENIAYGYRTPEAVVEGWLNSPGHRANIMNCNLKDIGVGHFETYWTQNFGVSR